MKAMKNISKTFAAAAGFAGGVLNGIFGAGGGSVTVPVLEAGGADARTSHAMSVAVMFCVSAVTVFGCMIKGNAPFAEVRELLPAGIAGAAAGALILRRADNSVLRRIFGALLIWCGGRLFFA